MSDTDNEANPKKFSRVHPLTAAHAATIKNPIVRAAYLDAPSDEPREPQAIDYDKASGKWSTRKMTAEEEKQFDLHLTVQRVREKVTYENAPILAAVLAEVAALRGNEILLQVSPGRERAELIHGAALLIDEVLRHSKESRSRVE